MKKQKPRKKNGRSKKKKQQQRNDEPDSSPTWVETRLRWMPAVGSDEEPEVRRVGTLESESDVDAGAATDARTVGADQPRGTVKDHDLSIVTWNVLAQSYCTMRSHARLPKRSQQVVFDRTKRCELVRRTLELMHDTLAPDMFALQEVDPPLDIRRWMESLGYSGIESPTHPSGNDGRVDACCLYYRNRDWTCVEHEIVRFDDLVTMAARDRQNGTAEPTNFKGSSRQNNNTNRRRRNIGNLQGLQASFRRRNMAVMTRMEHKATKKRVAVVVAHLYWNPAYEYVKLCQAHYLMKRAADFCHDQVPLIVCGDFNSQPGSHVHRYLVNGFTNARMTAPWHHILPPQDLAIASADDPSEAALNDNNDKECADETASDMQRLTISESTPDGAGEIADVKYLLDYTLNKLTRWLRILGIDAALETEEEERLRTSKGDVKMFRRCAFEKRTLVTTSSRLLHRRDCPPGAYLLTTKSLTNLEMALPHLLASHGVVLDPRKFLSRCVVCNGSIQPVTEESKRQEIFRQHQAPVDDIEEMNESGEKMDVFQCAGCGQGYWWCDQPTSSASRVKDQATRLLELCIEGGVPIEGDLGMFDFVDADGIKQRQSGGKDKSANAAAIVGPSLEVVEWLKQSSLCNPFGGTLRSTYADPDEPSKEMMEFTNVTADFTGLLDYVIYQPGRLELKRRLYVPETFDDLNCQNILRGHLLPSFVWPSDHLALGGCFSFVEAGQGSVAGEQGTVKRDGSNVGQSAVPSTDPAASTDGTDPAFCAPTGLGAPAPSSAPQPQQHGIKCGCGCVPNIPSLFEMAEMRKKAREDAERRAP